MYQYLIVCPLVFLAGFVDAIAGGGGLISLPAYIIAGVPAHFALGTNKLASAMGTTVSTARYLKNGYLKGRQMVKMAVCASIVSLAGSAIGSSLSLMVSEQVLKNLMIPVLPIVAFYVLRNKNLGSVKAKEPLPEGAAFAIAMAAAFLVGANGKCPTERDFIFYGNLKHSTGAVEHMGDNLTGEGDGDDEQIMVDLSKVPAAIERIAFTCTIYDAESRRQNFGQVSNAFIRIVDQATGTELIRYDLAEDFSIETAIVVG